MLFRCVSYSMPRFLIRLIHYCISSIAGNLLIVGKLTITGVSKTLLHLDPPLEGFGFPFQMSDFWVTKVSWLFQLAETDAFLTRFITSSEMQKCGRRRNRYPDISLQSRISRIFLRKEDYKTIRKYGWQRTERNMVNTHKWFCVFEYSSNRGRRRTKTRVARWRRCSLWDLSSKLKPIC